MTGLFLINILMALAWAAVTGSFSLINLVFGFAIGTAGLYLIREQVGTASHFTRTFKAFSLFGLFLYELIVAAVRVAWMVLKPQMNVQPGVIAYPLTVQKDFEIVMLANMITLTPGTLSVDVSEDRQTLYVHCLDVPDSQKTIDEIKNGFERKILEVFG